MVTVTSLKFDDPVHAVESEYNNFGTVIEDEGNVMRDLFIGRDKFALAGH